MTQEQAPGGRKSLLCHILAYRETNFSLCSQIPYDCDPQVWPRRYGTQGAGENRPGPESDWVGLGGPSVCIVLQPDSKCPGQNLTI